MNIFDALAGGEKAIAASGSLWSRLMTDVKIGALDVGSAVLLTEAIVTAVHDYKSGNADSIFSSIQSKYPTVIPLVETAASIIFGPEAGDAVGLVFDLLAMSHKMTPEEEKIWMDHASQTTGL